MLLNYFLMLISILKSILLEMTTVLPWFIRKVQIFHGHLRIYYSTVTGTKMLKQPLQISIQNLKLIFSTPTTSNYFFSKRGFPTLCIIFQIESQILRNISKSFENCIKKISKIIWKDFKFGKILRNSSDIFEKSSTC